LRLLVDEDISPRTADFLRQQGFDVKEVIDISKGGDDRYVVELAIEQDRWIITQDKDFGEIYYFSDRELRIAVVRPSTQSVEAVNDILENHLSGLEREEYGLFILQEDKIRKLS
jgi:predicted nuclease of predicted toxin-antitoxin system